MSQQLPGDFDITIAPVMDAWGFTTEERHVPSAETLSAALTLVDSTQLEVDGDTSTARLLQAGMEVDLGAVAKGFAAGEAEEALRAAGVERATIDLGGNVTVIGTRPDGDPWRVAVKDPRNTDGYLCILELEDVTLSTSGGYERYFERTPACCPSRWSRPTTCWPTPCPPLCLWRGRRRLWTSGGAGTTSSWCCAPMTTASSSPRGWRMLSSFTTRTEATPMRSPAADRSRPTLWDGLLALLVAAAAVALLFFLRPAESNFLTASVVLEGELIAEYDLSALTGPVTITLEQTDYPLTIRLEPGRVCIGESACPSQDCVHTGWISRAGEQIICLPNRLVISLTGGQQEFDAVTG